MRVGGQVATGDERAHVDVVGEDVVTDELAEEQHEIGEFHPLALVSRLSFTNTQTYSYLNIQSSAACI